MRIGASLNGIERRLLNAANEATAAATVNAIRLATGDRVNSPADDPSAFLQISRLESRYSELDTTLTQIESAANVVAQTQLSLDSIRTELSSIRELLLEDEDQSLTTSERTERQASIDASIDQINLIATSEVEGRRRLDGGADFDFQGGRTDAIDDLEIYAARDSSIRINVQSRATRGQLTYTGASGQTTAAATFTIEGRTGSHEFTVAQNDALTDVADSINQRSHSTGVTAAVSGDTLTLKTVDYGSRETIDVAVSSGSFAVTGGDGNGSDSGTDGVAKINDRTVTGDGNQFTYNANGTRFSVDVAANFVGEIGTIEISSPSVAEFTVTPDPAQAVQFALPGVQASHFRGVSGSLDQLASGGTLAGLASNTSQAIRVIDEALGRLTQIEGRVDGFANAAIQSSATLLDGFATAVDDTLNALNTADPNEESLLLAKNQELAETALTSLSVLEQQRTLVVSLLSQIAGV